MTLHRHAGWLLICAASLAWGFEPKATPFTNPLKGGQSGMTPGMTAPSNASLPKVSSEAPALGARALRGILLNGENSWANVDGDLVRKGELLEGWRLDRLEPASVHFSRRGKKQVIELQRPKVVESTTETVLGNVPGSSGTTSASASSPVAPLPSTTPAATNGALPQELFQKLIGTK